MKQSIIVRQAVTERKRRATNEVLAIRFNRTVTTEPCGWVPKHRIFNPLPQIVTSDPIDMIVRMKTMPDGSRRMITRRDSSGRAV